MSTLVPFSGLPRQVILVVGFVVMIVLNGLAGTTLFGSTTSAVSNANANPFTPDGTTFAVWGVIYVFGLAFVVYQALPSKRYDAELNAISPFVLGVYALNSLWLIVNGKQFNGVSLIIIFFYLLTLRRIYTDLNIGLKLQRGKERSWAEFFLLTAPWSLMTSWVVAANFANLSLTLTSWGWQMPSSFAQAEVFVVGSIASYIAFTRRDVPYSAVAVWALAGIIRGQPKYTDVQQTCVAMIVVALLSLVSGFAFRYFNPNAFSATFDLADGVNDQNTKEAAPLKYGV
eukprot:TRINITY_DN529_c0_g1_i2.p1 TRINITY_DN529_c0_g1~~TRINITY_DN529_c0_g1_i2.p1  ORF type:complete len:286 (+),score=74.61 TRINITY_DN529_c0_g1_i2:39-896(+)